MNTAAALQVNLENSWVKVSCGELNLLFYQSAVQTIETHAAVTPASGDQLEAGWLDDDHEEAPVFCFSSQLALLREIPKTYAYLALLKSTNGVFGLACDKIQTYGSQEALQPIALPGCMLLTSSALKTYVVLEGKIYFIAEPDALEALISAYGNKKELS